MKMMLKVAAMLVALAVIGYWALPQYRSLILGAIPIAATLLCPLSMVAAMWLMRRGEDEPRNSSSPPARPDTRSPEQHI
ncbi:MAG: DUF2933 domain-containing protein [Burkholderiales bacterium]|uniref:DUF2933 domain-containing protein n=1 Tax=Pandoraea sp. TaxID=1883445 RepID=UPI0023A331E2|nr:DUF2933 domain-containing protein [Pandoraea sp.]MDE2289938.1 DUF2933 domain-containing protein [Burkholderiales bacterium]MDE2608597.1 DUF2933 domain-containing protein [Burkholderiales bacterium]